MLAQIGRVYKCDTHLLSDVGIQLLVGVVRLQYERVEQGGQAEAERIAGVGWKLNSLSKSCTYTLLVSFVTAFKSQLLDMSKQSRYGWQPLQLGITRKLPRAHNRPNT